MKANRNRLVIFGAIAANGCIAITKFVAAALTGSSAMFSEGIHSSVDTGDGLLLLLGTHLSRRPPDEEHPYGHGAELYFWSLMVAVLIFGVGGGVSIYEGILHLIEPTATKNAVWSYGVLGAALIAEGISWTIAFRELLSIRGERSLWQTIHDSKDPTVFVIFFEDSAAIAGIVVAFLGVFLSDTYGLTAADGTASIIIGLLLAGVAITLILETRGLLLGESADQRTVEGIRKIASADPSVLQIKKPLTLHFGPEEILLCLDIEFISGLTARQIENAIDRIEHAIRQSYPRVKQIFLEADSIRAPE